MTPNDTNERERGGGDRERGSAFWVGGEGPEEGMTALSLFLVRNIWEMRGGGGGGGGGGGVTTGPF